MWKKKAVSGINPGSEKRRLQVTKASTGVHDSNEERERGLSKGFCRRGKG